MNVAQALAKLRALAPPVLTSDEAAAVWGEAPGAATKALWRLGRAGLVVPLRKGLYWIGPGPADPLVVLEHLTAPWPSYLTAISALYARGALSQIPVVHHAATLGRSRRLATRVATYQLHHLAPELFGGFEVLPSGAKLATVEKALFDLAWLGAARSRELSRPPELELPRLNRAELSRWVDRVAAPRRRAMVERRLAALTGSGGRGSSRAPKRNDRGGR